VRRIDAEGEEELLWGQRQVFVAFNILYGQIESGRYQELATAPELTSELGRLADQDGAEFEGRVAEEIEQLGFAVARSVKRLGGEKLRRSPSEDLGDIDVLAADPTEKTIWAVECKSLSGSLSSSEVVLEMTAHFDQAGTTSVTKHGERVAWLCKRMQAALERLGLPDDADDWELRGLIVTGRDVIAPFIDDLPFPCVPIHELAPFLTGTPADD
jgi:Holliday junction resolvase-like predicted endonuclease